MINLIDIKNVLILFLPACAQNDLKITWELPQAVKLLLMGKVCLLFTLLLIFLDSNISTSFRVTINFIYYIYIFIYIYIIYYIIYYIYIIFIIYTFIYYIYIIYFMYLKYTLNI